MNATALVSDCNRLSSSTNILLEIINSKHYICLYSRGGGCSFQDKIIAATLANWTAAIVHNREGNNNRVPMAGEKNDVVPSVFMG